MSRGGGRGAGAAGRGGRTFSLESMNLSRDAIPLPTLQPPPAFPKLVFPVLPVRDDSNQEELLEIKRDLVTSFRNSRFAEDTSQSQRRVVRYSDRYSTPISQGSGNEWDYRLFPAELQPSTKKMGKKKKNISVKKDPANALTSLPNDDVDEKSGDESGEGEGDEEAAEVHDEDMGEEETDYALTYFDNGEDYLEPENDDNADEGPTY